MQTHPQLTSYNIDTSTIQLDMHAQQKKFEKVKTVSMIPGAQHEKAVHQSRKINWSLCTAYTVTTSIKQITPIVHAILNMLSVPNPKQMWSLLITIQQYIYNNIHKIFAIIRYSSKGKQEHVAT